MAKVLAVGGDPGGARTLLPVLSFFEQKQIPFLLVAHQFLNLEAPASWPRVPPPSDISDLDTTIRWLEETGCTVVIFTSSVQDIIPLSIARAARHKGLPVIHLLDHWASYTERLETDGLPTFFPDIYTVMDDLAYREATDHGIPEETLVVTGHPSLAGLARDYDDFLNSSGRSRGLCDSGFSPDRIFLVFISEPIEQYYRTHPCPGRKEFNEKTALRRLCFGLQRFSNELQVALVSHPKEDADGLMSVWRECRGALDGGLLKLDRGRRAIFLADGVLGMNSTLMLEAWLLGKPVLSVQAWDNQEKVINILKKDGIRYLMSADDEELIMEDFLAEVKRSYLNKRKSVRPELEFHADSLDRIAECVKGLFGKRVNSKGV
jgi:hypothetical protein